MTEVAGVEELGAIGRGEDMEITTYLERGMTSELSGNIIDLCPVGALTSRPYSFAARPWELQKTQSIDVNDAVGCNIRVDARGREVMRVLPRNNDAVNEEWISDKTRFVWDGLGVQRLDHPYVRRRGKLVEASWAEAFAAIAQRMKGLEPGRFGAIAGDLAGAEEMFALKQLADRIGSPNMDCRQDGAQLDPALGRASYLFNTTIAGIEEADALLIVGANPRLEAAVLNARIRKRWGAGRFPIGVIGEQADLTYPYDYLGAGPETLSDLAGGGHAFHKTLAQAERPMLILGQSALARPDGAAILSLAARIAASTAMLKDGWNGFNVLHNAAARVAGLDLGFVPGKGGLDVAGMVQSAGKGELDVLYLLGADEIDMDALGKAFVIYQGTHGDRGAHRADVILPGAAYTEKDALYVNTEGRPQTTERAVFPPGEAREDWAIIRALSAVLGHTLPFDNPNQLRAAMVEAVPHFAKLDTIVPADAAPLQDLAKTGGRVHKEPFGHAIDDFYLTNPIARASNTMSQMSALIASGVDEVTGTHG
jgi:NADH-quinone oxidoreductase subunit G